MKKTLLIFICLALAMAMVSCGSTGKSASGGSGSSGRAVNSALPQFVKDAVKNAPEDAVIGIGTAKMATLAQSRTIAQTRARADISRVMNTMMSDMVRDYTAGSEVDLSATLAFQENITVALSRSQLVGAAVTEEDMDADGNYWVVMMMGKTNAVNEINQAAAAAKLAVPAMASFNAEDRMNAAFENYYKSEQGFTDR